VIRFHGFDACIVGHTDCWDGNQRVTRYIYSADKILGTLMAESGMSYEEALEYFDYNIAGLYAGESTPIILYRHDPEELVI
jgi:hypothetical protein